MLYMFRQEKKYLAFNVFNMNIQNEQFFKRTSHRLFVSSNK